jgi:hypothetical protein
MQQFSMDIHKYPGLAKWVVGCLAAHKKPNDIIFQLCKQTGWDWKQAQQFVEDVAEENQKEIHIRRSPLLIGLGFLFVISGAVLTFSSILDLNDILSGMQWPMDFSQIIDYIFMARSGVIMAAKLVTGVAMLLGGGIGVWNAMSAAMTGGEKVL